ncbi:MAG: hypothetical protein AAB449_02980 [Patescibacteria group bacterium]
MASCRVYNNATPSTNLSTALSSTGTATGAILGPTNFTLSCTDNNSISSSAQASITVLPAVQEI